MKPSKCGYFEYRGMASNVFYHEEDMVSGVPRYRFEVIGIEYSKLVEKTEDEDWGDEIIFPSQMEPSIKKADIITEIEKRILEMKNDDTVSITSDWLYKELESMLEWVKNK